MTSLTIQIPDALKQRAQELALQRGDTIEHLIKTLLEEHSLDR